MKQFKFWVSSIVSGAAIAALIILAAPHLHDPSIALRAQGQTAITASDTFTASGSGKLYTFAGNPVSTFAVQLKGTGAAATTATCTLQGSLNGTDFTTILTYGADGVVVWQASGVFNPVAFFRTNCSVITLGSATNVIAYIVAIS